MILIQCDSIQELIYLYARSCITQILCVSLYLCRVIVFCFIRTAHTLTSTACEIAVRLRTMWNTHICCVRTEDLVFVYYRSYYVVCRTWYRYHMVWHAAMVTSSNLFDSTSIPWLPWWCHTNRYIIAVRVYIMYMRGIYALVIYIYSTRTAMILWCRRCLDI